ncbi:dual oxidase maturation factor 1-like isoform X2 [Tachypleus tridentatus]|uniref:dual oxidase maturation factor 1-like isoform X2 n=1 Tax=Tachypleus tridentatus TaxID=6853 RepID=UPI003FD1D7C0
MLSSLTRTIKKITDQTFHVITRHEPAAKVTVDSTCLHITPQDKLAVKSLFSRINMAMFIFLVFLTLVLFLDSSYWLVSRSMIKSQYGARSGSLVSGEITVTIGLYHVTVSLKGNVSGNGTEVVNILHTFNWEDDDMKKQLKVALQHGLSYPVLTVLEYFVEENGWTPRFCLAGRIAVTLLWISLFFCAMSLLLWSFDKVEDSRIGGALCISGILMVGSALAYNSITSKKPLIMYFAEGVLFFSYAWSFFAAGFVGSLTSVFGIVTLATSSEIYKLIYHQKSPIKIVKKYTERLSVPSHHSLQSVT